MGVVKDSKEFSPPKQKILDETLRDGREARGNEERENRENREREQRGDRERDKKIGPERPPFIRISRSDPAI